MRTHLDSGMLHFLVIWENLSNLFWILETTFRDLFSFGKIQEWNNQPTDIGRPNKFFLCIISGSNGIHRYRKKPYQIEIFLSTIFWLLIWYIYIRTVTTKSIIALIVKYRLFVEPCKLRKSRILQIWWSKSFRKCSWWKKYEWRIPLNWNGSMNLRNCENSWSLSIQKFRIWINALSLILPKLHWFILKISFQLEFGYSPCMKIPAKHPCWMVKAPNS